MRPVWKRGGGDIERELRAARPEPPDAFVRSVEARVTASGSRRSPRLVFASAVTVLLLVPFVALGGFSAIADAAKGGQGNNGTGNGNGSGSPSTQSHTPAHKQYGEEKVTICHKPGTRAQKTMEVPKPLVSGHMAHGDTLGPCPSP